MSSNGYDIVHASDFEKNGNWSLVRRGLNLQSFGINAVEIAPGEKIPEHQEVASDQEEVFIVLSGNPQIVIDGEPHDAPAGTYCRLSPEPLRTVHNTGSEPAVVLIASAPRSSGYKPMSWA